jgi:hypothetical protein
MAHMPMLILAAIAPLGAWIHLRRHPEPRGRRRTLEVYLLWWVALAIGLSGTIGGLFHIFDGPAIAEEIGFTRGDGGFQFENAMGDIAIGVAALLCLRIRGTFWLAVLLIAAIQYYGDAYGHVYQWLENDNTKSGNVGPPLWLDVVVPTVGLLLYRVWRRAGGEPEPTACGS